MALFAANREGLGLGRVPEGAAPTVARRETLAAGQLRRRRGRQRAAPLRSSDRHLPAVSRRRHELLLRLLRGSRASETLEQAQANKLRRATLKLGLRPGDDGGRDRFRLGLSSPSTSRKPPARVFWPRTSRRSRSGWRASGPAEAGVGDRVIFQEVDYRDLAGRFDRVVSVGMMEHVGIGHFDAYFGTIRRLLKDDGYAFIHCIGRKTPPGTTGPFIRKYIFPGGYVPSLSEVFAATERNALWVADMEVLRLHYYYTLRHWRDPLRRQPRQGRGNRRRAVLPHVGILSRRGGGRLPQRFQHGLPASPVDQDRRRADRARRSGTWQRQPCAGARAGGLNPDMSAAPQPFSLHVPDADIADLRERLARTRFPDQAPDAPWAYGTDVSYMRDLVAYWYRNFDWRAAGSTAQRVSAIQGRAGRHRGSFPARPRQGAEAVSAAAVAWLARIGVRVPRHHSAPRRPGAVRRRSRRRFYRCRAVAARLRAFLRTRPETVLRERDRRLLCPPDGRCAWLPALRRAGRRLGRVYQPRTWVSPIPTSCSASTSTCSPCAAICPRHPTRRRRRRSISRT